MNPTAKIFVAGHRGLVGSAILRKLQAEGYDRVVTRTHRELDLVRQSEVEEFFRVEKPEYIFLAAAKVGGILANSIYPAQFIYENLMIQSNLIQAAHKNGVKKLLFLGSSCIYPRDCPQPIKEEYLLSGKLETTNEPYAVAKIAGIKMCQAYNKQYNTCFISAMPTNVYGPGDNFDLESSHVLPALIRKFSEAVLQGKSANSSENKKSALVVWGTGSARREFLHVDDLADACLFLMKHYSENEIINIGTGRDLSIRELAEVIRDITGFKGDITYDPSKPDGTPQKLLDTRKLQQLGWESKIHLAEGVRMTFEWFKTNYHVIIEKGSSRLHADRSGLKI
ncbi:MAG: GDP-L-fucose synthase [Desulfobacteraceae bacterium]|nr:MAG: GDP-L-fucose synthase [Desulfobacteraceae bacterium]